MAHKRLHEDEHHDGGIDEIAEGSLLPQIPTPHQATHLSGGSDAIDGLNANQIHDGSVTNDEFGMLAGISTISPIASKEYVDDKIQGLDWQESVIRFESDPPAEPDVGDRYLVEATATGDWTGWEDSIVEWTGSEWLRIEPDQGFATMTEDTGVLWTYNGTDWVKFGSAISHGSLSGLGEDDHAQYLLVNGSRAMSGALDMGTNNISETGNIVPHSAGNQELGSQALPFNILNTNRITGTGAGLPGGGTLVINTLDNPNGRVLMNPILHINQSLDLNGLAHRGLSLGKGVFYPKIITQEAEPATVAGEMLFHENDVAGERFLIINIGGTTYKVELTPDA